MQAYWIDSVEGAGNKPLSVDHSADRIQLCVLPDPMRATSKGLFGLAPTGMLVSSAHGKSPSLDIIVQPHYCSFLLQCLPSRTPRSPRPFALWRGDFPQGLTLSAVLLLPPRRLAVVYLASILWLISLIIYLRMEMISI